MNTENIEALRDIAGQLEDWQHRKTVHPTAPHSEINALKSQILRLADSLEEDQAA